MKVIGKIEIDSLVDVVCDVCDKSCKVDDFSNLEYAMLLADWGYGSTRDGEQHEAHFCQECYEHLINHITYRMNGTVRITEKSNDG